ncbi:hypothetical protein [Pseudochrobactrum sp. B5]|uniref:hypothetical protein n=1 Tax=Pseudochrobactrum sp. B5 TaxID=1289478 RepID=UPI0009524106|nr:hypothetical protein [Pseudochrobactrum sp. B5]
MRIIITAALLLTIAGCSLGSDTSRTLFEWFVSYVKIGSSNDVWLAKGSFGYEDRVALIFGYANDMAACEDIAAIMNEKYPAARHHCVAAN